MKKILVFAISLMLSATCFAANKKAEPETPINFYNEGTEKFVDYEKLGFIPEGNRMSKYFLSSNSTPFSVK